VWSITKRHLTDGEIQAVLERAFGPGVALRTATEFTEGCFAAVYGVRLTDGRDLVLKVSPPQRLRLLRYEVDLAHTEIEFYRMATAAGIPVPAVHFSDPDGGYLLIDRLSGRSLHAVNAGLPDGLAAPPRERLRREIGAMCARINAVTGPAFGYPRRDGHTRSDRWRTSFLAIVDDILADAVEYRRELPVPADRIATLIRGHADLLDEVQTPALVHFDLWDGNIFVREDGDGYAIEGIIDGERAFYGDPIAELVSLALLGDPETVPGLLEGYFGEPSADRQRADALAALHHLP
jgi:Ser/Thr protein kinase RdoA (MazF antagonist)